MVAEMEFRINFFMGIFVECAWLVSKVLYAVVLYKSGIEIEGYNSSDMIIFVGMHTITTGILISLFWPNYSKLTQYIKEGTLDIYIVKPVSLQFMVTLRYMSFGSLIPNVLGGVIMVIWGMQNKSLTFDITTILGFLLFLVAGTIVSYGLFLLPQMLAFKIVEMTPLNNVVGQLQEVNNVPFIVYPNWIQKIGIYIFPIFVISNFFPMYVLGRINLSFIIWTVLSPIIVMIVTRLLWKKAVCSYTSASS
ncbi:MAG: hypothetical protein BWY74_03741 [Firmicutes bacterium ADurb.Bin419]|nr:MAG: hypothetical protein BWY74_03741 [Firmicutes bacterium ADurb.Bin419]